MEKIIILDESLDDYDIAIEFLRKLFPECQIQYIPQYTRNRGFQSGQLLSLDSLSFSIIDNVI